MQPISYFMYSTKDFVGTKTLGKVNENNKHGTLPSLKKNS